MRGWGPWVGALGAVAGLAVLPAVLTRDLLTALFFTFIFATLAANYDILGGFLRHINLGQGAFFGLAAYVTAVMLTRTPGGAGRAAPDLAAAIAAAVVVTAGFAALVAYPLFQVRGAYFAVITLGLVLIVQQVVLNAGDLSGGSYGITIPARYYPPLTMAYYASLALAVAAVLLNVAITRSRLGIAFHALRDSQATASAIGVNPFRYKQVALVLASVPSAAAGCLFGLFMGHIYVETVLGLEITLLPVIMAMLGGTGHVLGPVVGAVIVRGIDVGLGYVAVPIPRLALYGLMLLFIGLFLPGGILLAGRGQTPGHLSVYTRRG
jgi:branched-chain amino acid transport system permease protein